MSTTLDATLRQALRLVRERASGPGADEFIQRLRRGPHWLASLPQEEYRVAVALLDGLRGHAECAARRAVQ